MCFRGPFRLGQRVAFGNQLEHLFLGHTAVQDDADPMALVHVVGGNHGGVGAFPEVAPLRLRLYVNPQMPLPLKEKSIGLVVGLVAHGRPVGIVKGVIFIAVRQPHAKPDDIGAGIHFSTAPGASSSPRTGNAPLPAFWPRKRKTPRARYSSHIERRPRQFSNVPAPAAARRSPQPTPLA